MVRFLADLLRSRVLEQGLYPSWPQPLVLRSCSRLQTDLRRLARLPGSKTNFKLVSELSVKKWRLN